MRERGNEGVREGGRKGEGESEEGREGVKNGGRGTYCRRR